MWNAKANAASNVLMCLPLLLNLKRSEAVLDQTDKSSRQAQGTELPFVLKTKREHKLSLRKVFLLSNIQSLSSFFYCCYFIFFNSLDIPRAKDKKGSGMLLITQTYCEGFFLPENGFILIHRYINFLQRHPLSVPNQEKPAILISHLWKAHCRC